jgi:RND family efflux transporter MFP subunit
MSTMNEKFGKIVKVAWRPVAGAAGLVVMALWMAGAFESKVGPGKGEHLPGFALQAQAKTITVKMARSASPVEVVGTAASERWVNLSARLPATIQTMLVRAGDAVTNGQVLATLDDRDIREQIAGVEAQFKQAEVEYNRTIQLFEKGATTDQAKVAALTGLEAARARLQQMRVMLSYASLTSPLDGVVTDRRFEAGDLVAPGQLVMSVYDPRIMRLEVPVPVRLLSRFTLDQTVLVDLDGVNKPVKGVVREIVSEVDPLSRSQKVKITLEQEGKPILPGTYGRITVDGDSHDSLWVPVSAVYRVGQQELAQVVSDGRVTRRIVRTGVAGEGRVEILSGLSDGEVILVEPVKGE